MSRDEYDFADLQPEVVDEIQIVERRLSDETGQPITLIAYRSDAQPPAKADAEDPPRAPGALPK